MNRYLGFLWIGLAGFAVACGPGGGGGGLGGAGGAAAGGATNNGGAPACPSDLIPANDSDTSCPVNGQVCEYGMECCCGICKPSYTCSCFETWSCDYSDVCLGGGPCNQTGSGGSGGQGGSGGAQTTGAGGQGGGP